MPNIKSSERSVITDALRRSRNTSTKSEVRTVVRKTAESVQGGNKATAENLLVAAYKTIDKAVAKGVIHKNAAARKKSRLAKKINAL
ncbi:30S ribosomal protein S20 [Acetonema longum]|uniref:Small ribosomal subunit protein bS20 n=1 Tax=Acetonema longum DSM 6540 TaxID=1009370 RepID=F7NKV1_9FIRM|nr:30S ribosomal protein S20 [Acetonema longum]EGO63294.1 30S ribosomal protein S20 [Acetonema longum DSM 6540]